MAFGRLCAHRHRGDFPPTRRREKCYRGALRWIKFLVGTGIGSDRNSSINWGLEAKVHVPMSTFLARHTRTHSCSTLRTNEENQKNNQTNRNQNNQEKKDMVFIDLRDREGITQLR